MARIAPHEATIFVIGGGPELAAALREAVGIDPITVVALGTTEALPDGPQVGQPACAIVAAFAPAIDVTATVAALQRRYDPMPIAVATEPGDTATAIAAMRAGAFDAAERSSAPAIWRQVVNEGLALHAGRPTDDSAGHRFQDRLDRLTPRERAVFDLMLLGRLTKLIAHQLAISPRTVEVHRANVLRKFNTGRAVDLIRLAARSGWLATRDE